VANEYRLMGMVLDRSAVDLVASCSGYRLEFHSRGSLFIR